MNRDTYLERVRALAADDSNPEAIVSWVARALDDNLPADPDPEHEHVVLSRLGPPEVLIAQARQSRAAIEPEPDSMIKLWAGLAVVSTLVLFPLPLLAIPLAGLAISMAFKREHHSLPRLIAIVFSTITVLVSCVVAFVPGMTDHLRSWTTIGIATVALCACASLVILLLAKRQLS